MKFLLLLLSTWAVFAFYSGNTKLSKERREKLAKWFGQDLETRRARLEHLLDSRPDHMRLSKKQKEIIKKIHEKMRHVHHEDSSDSKPVSLFELNEKKGVSDYLFQGDIRLNEEQLDEIERELAQTSEPGREKRQASMSAKKWTDNTVYYYFDKSTASNARKVASTAAALEYLQYHTCINFVENATAPARIRIISGEGCYSAVGMTGRVQDLSIDDGCEVIGTVAHEFTHALGIWHTQMRSDRDTYVTIDLSDVPENKHHNFVKVAAAQNSITVPYDYGSFMHYGANFFVDKPNAISVLPKDSRYIHTIGGDLTSFYDIQMINDHYGCSTVCPAATSAKCKNGGVPNPRNCATCNCPLGYDGDICDKRPLDPICGEILTASTAWQKKKFTFGNLTAFDQRDDYTICTHWITAPTGKKVQTKITQMANPQCVYSCSFNGIEIKTNADPRVTNPRFCCPEFMNQEMSSDLNPTPVVAYNRVGKTTFEIEYRFVDSDTTGSLNSTSSKAHESTTTTTTKAPSTNTSISTTTKKPSENCKNDREEAYCAFQLHCDPNFCNPTDPGVFRNVKFRCGLFCGLCGKVAPGCADLLTNCADNKQKRACTILEPNLMEYACAKSCGFCENPN